MPKACAILSILFLSATAAVAQSAVEAPIAEPAAKAAEPAGSAAEPAAEPAEDSVKEMVKLREEVGRLQRTLEQQRSQLDRQIEDLKKAMETRLAGVANGIDAVRISVDAVKNAVAGIQLPKRTAITIAADSSAPILCGPQGCEATALDHCKRVGYETAHVVHKLEAPAKWLLTFVCSDR